MHRQGVLALPVLQQHVFLGVQCAAKDLELDAARLLLAALAALDGGGDRLVGDLFALSRERDDQSDSRHAAIVPVNLISTYATARAASSRGSACRAPRRRLPLSATPQPL